MYKHIIGKVYDLTQENFQALIEQLELEQEKNKILKSNLIQIESDLSEVKDRIINYDLEGSCLFDDVDNILITLYNINR